MQFHNKLKQKGKINAYANWKKIIVKPLEVKHGNLIVSNSKPSQFEIIAVGDEVTKVNTKDTIYLHNHYGAEIEHDQQRYLVIEEDNILAKLSSQSSSCCHH